MMIYCMQISMIFFSKPLPSKSSIYFRRLQPTKVQLKLLSYFKKNKKSRIIFYYSRLIHGFEIQSTAYPKISLRRRQKIYGTKWSRAFKIPSWRHWRNCEIHFRKRDKSPYLLHIFVTRTRKIYLERIHTNNSLMKNKIYICLYISFNF